jgi:hypothetical protein
MADDGGDRVDQAWITAVIVGSAESPDPILVWVKHLEREGKVRDVIVMESFPVQIRLTAPQHIIDELNPTLRKRRLRWSEIAATFWANFAQFCDLAERLQWVINSLPAVYHLADSFRGLCSLSMKRISTDSVRPESVVRLN